MTQTITNSKFAQEDAEFLRACELANVDPSKRQASKFRREEGLAWKALRFVTANVFEDEQDMHERLQFAGLRRQNGTA